MLSSGIPAQNLVSVLSAPPNLQKKGETGVEVSKVKTNEADLALHDIKTYSRVLGLRWLDTGTDENRSVAWNVAIHSDEVCWKPRQSVFQMLHNVGHKHRKEPRRHQVQRNGKMADCKNA